jgi:hypothetical protein
VSGLVAAYGFTEGSGTTVADASGTGNGGVISGATWTASGKYGSALVFNGTSALVTINDAASLRLTTAMTLEAWVYPTAVSNVWRDVIYKADANYCIEASTDNSSRPAVGGTFSGPLYGPAALAANAWTHLAVTYEGTTLRFYVNGAQVASQAQTGNIATSANPLQIGGDSLYGLYFQGRIDEVRVYNRALSAAEIQTDMNTPVGTAVNTAPTISSIANQTTTANTAVGPLSFTVGDVETAAANLTVSGASSNTTLVPTANIVFGGSGANRTVMVTPAANQTGTSTITVTVSDGSLTATTTFTLTVNQAAADTTAPSAPTQLTAATWSSSQIKLSWTASTDNVGVTGYRVERRSGFGSFVQVGTTSGTTFNDTGLSSRTSYSYRVRATDAAGNLSGYSNVASARTR